MDSAFGMRHRVLDHIMYGRVECETKLLNHAPSSGCVLGRSEDGAQCSSVVGNIAEH
jgi:hypothetical protein